MPPVPDTYATIALINKRRDEEDRQRQLLLAEQRKAAGPAMSSEALGAAPTGQAPVLAQPQATPQPAPQPAPQIPPPQAGGVAQPESHPVPMLEPEPVQPALGPQTVPPAAKGVAQPIKPQVGRIDNEHRRPEKASAEGVSGEAWQYAIRASAGAREADYRAGQGLRLPVSKRGTFPASKRPMNETGQLYTNALRAAGIDNTGEPNPMSVDDWEAVAPGLQETSTGRGIIEQRENEIQRFETALAQKPENEFKSFSDVAAFYAETTTPLIAGYAKERLKEYGGDIGNPKSRANMWMDEESRHAAQTEVDRLNAEPDGLEPYTLARTPTGEWGAIRRNLSETQKKAIARRIEENAHRAAYEASALKDQLSLREYVDAKDDKRRTAIANDRQSKQAIENVIGGILTMEDLSPETRKRCAKQLGLSDAAQQASAITPITDEELASVQASYGVSGTEESVYEMPVGGEDAMVTAAVKQFNSGDTLKDAVAASIKKSIPSGLNAQGYTKLFNTTYSKAWEDVRTTMNAEVASVPEAAKARLMRTYRAIADATEPIRALTMSGDFDSAFAMLNQPANGIALTADSTTLDIHTAAIRAVFNVITATPGIPTDDISRIVLAKNMEALHRTPLAKKGVPAELQEAYQLYKTTFTAGVAKLADDRATTAAERQKEWESERLEVANAWQSNTGMAPTSIPGNIAYDYNSKTKETTFFASQPVLNLYKSYSDGSESGKKKQEFLRNFLGVDPQTGIVGGTLGPRGKVVSSVDPVMEKIVLTGLEGRDLSELTDANGEPIFSEKTFKTMRDEYVEIGDVPTSPIKPFVKSWYAPWTSAGDRPLSLTLGEDVVREPIRMYMDTKGKDHRYWWLARATAQYVAQQTEMDTVRSFEPRIRKAATNLLSGVGAIVEDNRGTFVDLDGRPVNPGNPEDALRAFKVWQEKMTLPYYSVWRDDD